MAPCVDVAARGSWKDHILILQMALGDVESENSEQKVRARSIKHLWCAPDWGMKKWL